MTTKSVKNIKPFLALAPEISQLCTPLRKYGIIHFSYLHNFIDGTQIKLGDLPDWQEHYFTNDLQKIGMYEDIPDWYNDGYTFWSSLTSPKQELPIIEIAREFICVDHALVICRKHPASCEFFFFAGSKDRPEMIDFYLNNLNLFEQFILTFKDQGAKLLNDVAKHKIQVIDTSRASETSHPKVFLPDQNRRIEFNKLSSLKITLKNAKGSIVLSRREWDCLYQLLQGKKMLAIGDSLFISRRTVEKHLDSIRTKFNCSSLTELVVTIIKHNTYLI